MNASDEGRQRFSSTTKSGDMATSPAVPGNVHSVIVDNEDVKRGVSFGLTVITGNVNIILDVEDGV